MEIEEIQSRLQEHGIDGWLLYDNHGSNRFVRELLEIPPHLVITRRLFYWIPAEGEPHKFLHLIEKGSLDFIPGKQHLFLSWTELEKTLKDVVGKAKKVAMEYSPHGENPYISVVDGGTIEMIQSLGVKVVSSDDLLQHFTSVLNDEQIQLHLDAAAVLEDTIAHVWEFITERIRADKRVTEYDVQKFIVSEFTAQNCITEDGPTCAVNEHSALPHYMATKHEAAEIHEGDFVLVDLWCKKDLPHSVYADITRVGIVGREPTPKQQEIFSIVKIAQAKALEFIKARFEEQQKVTGAEVDDVCRGYIQEQGYGDYFTHRSGHNIDTNVHGAGANLDNLETADRRKILPRTCFSIEPGIYLPGEFGVRLEHDVLVTADGHVQVTGGKEESIHCLL